MDDSVTMTPSSWNWCKGERSGRHCVQVFPDLTTSSQEGFLIVGRNCVRPGYVGCRTRISGHDSFANLASTDSSILKVDHRIVGED